RAGRPLGCAAGGDHGARRSLYLPRHAGRSPARTGHRGRAAHDGQRMPFPLFTVIGHTTLGCALFNLAEFADARVHLERADAAWEPGFPRLALDLAVLHRTMLAFTLLHQGLPAAGAQWIQRSLGHAEAL